MNLVPYKKDGIEIYVDTTTGESFCSIRGYARMANLSDTAIRKRITANQIDLKMAEVHTPQGLRTANLISEDLIVEWLPKDNHEMASKLMRLGVRHFLHKLAGYEVKSTAVNLNFFDMMRQQIDQLEAQNKRLDVLEAKIETRPEGYFSVAGWASLQKKSISHELAKHIGKRCANLSREWGYDMGKARDPRWGEVNTYHEDILTDVMGTII